MDFEEKAVQNINNDEEEFILPEELLLNSMLLFEEEDSSEEGSSNEQENAQEPEEDSRADVSEALNNGSLVNGSQNNQASVPDNTYVQDLDAQKQENYYQKVKKELSMYMLKRQQITESIRYKRIVDKKTRYAEETKGFSQEFGEISVDKSEKKINKNEYRHRSESGLKCKAFERSKKSSLNGLNDIDGLGKFREGKSSGLVKDFDIQRLLKKEREKKNGHVLRKTKRYKNLCIGEEKDLWIDEGRKKDLYKECTKEKEQYIDKDKKKVPCVDKAKKKELCMDKEKKKELYIADEKKKALFMDIEKKKESYIAGEKGKKLYIDKEKKKEALGLLIENQTQRLSDTASGQRHPFSIDNDVFESDKRILSLDDRFRKKYDEFSMKV